MQHSIITRSYYAVEKGELQAREEQTNTTERRKGEPFTKLNKTDLTSFIVGFDSKGYSKYFLICSHVFNLQF